ncbi:MAG: hypothetical protein ACFFG0_18150 [Candidatus Thorarchaeota archaeon]
MIKIPDRITVSMLENKVKFIAKNIKMRDRLGEFDLIIHTRYGGGNPYRYQLRRKYKTSGGESPFTSTYMTIREFYSYLEGFVQGIENKK